jgi:shikimate dehydrogenase
MYEMNEKVLRLGLVGKDVSKSMSSAIHAFILSEFGVRCEYESFSVTPDGFDDVARRLFGDFDGFNITIPYKRDIMEYLNGMEGDAFDFGAVNTVITATGVGYNTDGVGFLLMLETAGIQVKNKKILVLGAGGSGRSSAAALKKAGAQVFLYRRNREKLEEICAQLGVFVADDPESGGYDILINCTGVGMHDTEGVSPVTAKAFLGAKAAIDLIYTPEKSEFLRLAQECGLQTLNGAAMLFYQAYYSDCLYLNRQPDSKQAKLLYERYQRQGRNYL